MRIKFNSFFFLLSFFLLSFSSFFPFFFPKLGGVVSNGRLEPRRLCRICCGRYDTEIQRNSEAVVRPKARDALYDTSRGGDGGDSSGGGSGGGEKRTYRLSSTATEIGELFGTRHVDSETPPPPSMTAPGAPSAQSGTNTSTRSVESRTRSQSLRDQFDSGVNEVDFPNTLPPALGQRRISGESSGGGETKQQKNAGDVSGVLNNDDDDDDDDDDDEDEDEDDVEGEAKLARALLSNGSSSRLEMGRGSDASDVSLDSPRSQVKEHIFHLCQPPFVV